MKAIVRTADRVELRDVERPRAASGHVVVRVAHAGICRTDLLAADGALVTHPPIVLGHEASGVVVENGDGASVPVGARVAMDPALPCGRCMRCRCNARCASPRVLGVAVDGAFAEYVLVPSCTVHRIPDALSLRVAAYVEPVAATLAVLRAPLPARSAVLVVGNDRVAELTTRLLVAHGFDATRATPDACARRAEAWDVVVEATPSPEAIDAAIIAARPGALVVFKSRPAVPIALDVASVVRKELRLHGVHYGSFDDAIALLATGTLAVDDLLGDSFALDDFGKAFDCARADTSKKVFFAVQPG